MNKLAVKQRNELMTLTKGVDEVVRFSGAKPAMDLFALHMSLAKYTAALVLAGRMNEEKQKRFIALQQRTLGETTNDLIKLYQGRKEVRL